MAIFRDVHVTVNLANLSHNPPFNGTPEKIGMEGFYLQPWFVFNRAELLNTIGGDVTRFILQADAWNKTDFPLGGYIIWDDGHIKWAFRWQTVVPWSVDENGDPIMYLFFCQVWDSINSPP